MYPVGNSLASAEVVSLRLHVDEIHILPRAASRRLEADRCRGEDP